MQVSIILSPHSVVPSNFKSMEYTKIFPSTEFFSICAVHENYQLKPRQRKFAKIIIPTLNTIDTMRLKTSTYNLLRVKTLALPCFVCDIFLIQKEISYDQVIYPFFEINKELFKVIKQDSILIELSSESCYLLAFPTNIVRKILSRCDHLTVEYKIRQKNGELRTAISKIRNTRILSENVARMFSASAYLGLHAIRDN